MRYARIYIYSGTTPPVPPFTRHYLASLLKVIGWSGNAFFFSLSRSTCSKGRKVSQVMRSKASDFIAIYINFWRKSCRRGFQEKFSESQSGDIMSSRKNCDENEILIKKKLRALIISLLFS